jgi:hypothetical protein
VKDAVPGTADTAAVSRSGSTLSAAEQDSDLRAGPAGPEDPQFWADATVKLDASLPEVVARPPEAPLPEDVTKPPDGVPFPQANSLGRVVNLLGALMEGELFPEEVARRYRFDRRQASYYLSACAWLGLAERGGESGGPWRLTSDGVRAMSLPEAEMRLAVAEAIVSRPVFNEIWSFACVTGKVPGNNHVTWTMAMDAPGMSASTQERRSTTVKSWILTLLDWFPV